MVHRPQYAFKLECNIGANHEHGESAGVAVPLEPKTIYSSVFLIFIVYVVINRYIFLHIWCTLIIILLDVIMSILQFYLFDIYLLSVLVN